MSNFSPNQLSNQLLTIKDLVAKVLEGLERAAQLDPSLLPALGADATAEPLNKDEVAKKIVQLLRSEIGLIVRTGVVGRLCLAKAEVGQTPSPRYGGEHKDGQQQDNDGESRTMKREIFLSTLDTQPDLFQLSMQPEWDNDSDVCERDVRKGVIVECQITRFEFTEGNLQELAKEILEAIIEAKPAPSNVCEQRCGEDRNPVDPRGSSDKRSSLFPLVSTSLLSSPLVERYITSLVMLYCTPKRIVEALYLREDGLPVQVGCATRAQRDVYGSHLRMEHPCSPTPVFYDVAFKLFSERPKAGVQGTNALDEYRDLRDQIFVSTQMKGKGKPCQAVRVSGFGLGSPNGQQNLCATARCTRDRNTEHVSRSDSAEIDPNVLDLVRRASSELAGNTAQGDAAAVARAIYASNGYTGAMSLRNARGELEEIVPAGPVAVHKNDSRVEVFRSAAQLAAEAESLYRDVKKVGAFCFDTAGTHDRDDAVSIDLSHNKSIFITVYITDVIGQLGKNAIASASDCIRSAAVRSESVYFCNAENEVKCVVDMLDEEARKAFSFTKGETTRAVGITFAFSRDVLKGGETKFDADHVIQKAMNRVELYDVAIEDTLYYDEADKCLDTKTGVPVCLRSDGTPDAKATIRALNHVLERLDGSWVKISDCNRAFESGKPSRTSRIIQLLALMYNGTAGKIMRQMAKKHGAAVPMRFSSLLDVKARKILGEDAVKRSANRERDAGLDAETARDMPQILADLCDTTSDRAKARPYAVCLTATDIRTRVMNGDNCVCWERAHTALDVPTYYAQSTSPLRRARDMLAQAILIARAAQKAKIGDVMLPRWNVQDLQITCEYLDLKHREAQKAAQVCESACLARKCAREGPKLRTATLGVISHTSVTVIVANGLGGRTIHELSTGALAGAFGGVRASIVHRDGTALLRVESERGEEYCEGDKLALQLRADETTHIFDPKALRVEALQFPRQPPLLVLPYNMPSVFSLPAAIATFKLREENLLGFVDMHWRALAHQTAIDAFSNDCTSTFDVAAGSWSVERDAVRGYTAHPIARITFKTAPFRSTREAPLVLVFHARGEQKHRVTMYGYARIEDMEFSKDDNLTNISLALTTFTAAWQERISPRDYAITVHILPAMPANASKLQFLQSVLSARFRVERDVETRDALEAMVQRLKRYVVLMSHQSGDAREERAGNEERGSAREDDEERAGNEERGSAREDDEERAGNEERRSVREDDVSSLESDEQSMSCSDDDDDREEEETESDGSDMDRATAAALSGRRDALLAVECAQSGYDPATMDAERVDDARTWSRPQRAAKRHKSAMDACTAFVREYLHESQRDASVAILQRSVSTASGAYRTPLAVHGPPGTGKTRTVAATIAALVKNDPKTRMLVLAPSNQAADNALCAVLDMCERSGVRTAGTMVRLYGAVLRESDEKWEFSLASDGKKRAEYFSATDHKRACELAVHRRVQENEEFRAKMDKLTKELDAAEDADKGHIMSAIRREVHKCENDVMNGARLVVSTLDTFVGFAQRKGNKVDKFSVAIIDESGQVSTIDSFIAWNLSQSRSLVLAGDPMQIGPVAPASSLHPQLRLAVSASPLESILSMRDDGTSAEFVVKKLTEQYRMLPAIMEGPSAFFYSGNLRRAARAAGPAESEFVPVTAGGGAPGLVVIDVDKSVEELGSVDPLPETMKALEESNVSLRLERRDDAGYDTSSDSGSVSGALTGELFFSRRNALQSEIALDVYKDLRQRGIAAKRIALVTPYRSNAALLLDMVVEYERKGRFLEDLPTIGTIHELQGSERDYVIFVTVRSWESECSAEQRCVERAAFENRPIDELAEELANQTNLDLYARGEQAAREARGALGFLTDWRLFNVALTRARLGAFVIADTMRLCRSSLLRDMVSYWYLSGVVVDADRARAEVLAADTAASVDEQHLQLLRAIDGMRERVEE